MSLDLNPFLEKIKKDAFCSKIRKSIIEAFEEVKDTIENNNIQDLRDFQKKTDESLGTENKEIVGAINEVSSQFKEKANKIDLDLQKARIDNLATLSEGSTTGDAELIDGRIAINSEKYNNIGDAIRSQISNIVSISPNLYEYGGSGLHTEQGITNPSEKYWYSKPIPCKIGDVLKINKRVDWQGSWFGVYDKNCELINITDGWLSSWLTKGDSYDTIAITEYNYEGFVVNENNLGYIVISFSDYDSVTDKNMNMIVKNNDYPSSYVANETKLKSNIKLSESQEEQVIDKANELIKINNNSLKKAVVLLNFDAFNFTDGRFDILKEYGFKATVTFGTPATPIYDEEKANKYKKVMTNGWDIGIYSATNWVKDKYGNEAFTSTSDEVVKAWEDYVKLALEDAELNGVYYPQTWFCRQNAYCDVLGNSLRKYGFKMCRGEDFTDYKKTPMYFNNDYSFATRTKGLYPSTVDGCLWEIEQCVNDTKGISIFSHGIYATDEEAESNFGCTETNLRTVLDKIKKYVNEGKLEVLTYNEMYNRYNQNDSNIINYNRILKMLTNN